MTDSKSSSTGKPNPAKKPPTPPAPPAPPAPLAPPLPPAAGYAPAQPYPVVVPLRPDEERNIGMLSHLISLLANLLSGGWISALIFYLLYRDRGTFVRAHTATELNFQLTLILAILAGFVLSFVIVGIFVLIAAPVLAIVFGIISTMKANRGEWYTYPIAIRFVH